MIRNHPKRGTRNLFLTLALITVSCSPSGEASDHPMTFELAVVPRDPDSTMATRQLPGGSGPVMVVEPPLLSGADLLKVRAVSQSKWYVLSGSHSTTTIVLTLKPDAAIRLAAALDRAVALADNLALVVDGQVIGVMGGQLQQGLDQNQLSIDAAFFSTGTQAGRKADAKALARQIQASIP